MKLIKNDVVCNIDIQIKEAEYRLKSERIYILESYDHLDHIAAYVAWKNVGGNIFIKSPLLPEKQVEEISKKLKSLDVFDSIIFHTSGTTGLPKLVVHKEKQMNQAIKMTTNGMKWSSSTNFLNFIPPFTSGFWHIVLPETVHHKSTLTLSSKETMLNDFEKFSNSIILVPGMIDQLRSKNVTLDLSNFSSVSIGASQVLPRHIEYVFNNKGNHVTHIYGATETCSTILAREVSNPDDETGVFLNLDPLSDNEFKIVDNELCIKGESLCENIQDFKFYDGWFQTNDLWEQKDNMIKFIGRSNDICKINGYQCSLLLLENISEETLNLGDCLAVPKNSHGSDWIELYYTNLHCKIDKLFFKEVFEKILPPCNIPRRYTYVEQLSRNSLGKKVRNAF
jgi:acyl-coenzyme A synthetase/AMP-(fatty) acid ligase